MATVAAATLAAPVTQARPHSESGRGSFSPRAAASAPAATARSASRSGNYSGTRTGHGDWDHRRHGYPRYRYYGGFGYPFGYGYGYGYGDPFGYGYPYFGNSAALYYYGTNRGYQQPVQGISVVEEVQQRLSRAGYYRGDIDGVIGDGTRSAVRRYQRAHRLRATGQIDDQLLASMGLG
ncbi:MAG: peptidoglycan-binding protein [Verrucomicrobiota bacterium]|nr:peptidoglycan-binding protein [Verrucomicrobiota bacterium]